MRLDLDYVYGGRQLELQSLHPRSCRLKVDRHSGVRATSWVRARGER